MILAKSLFLKDSSILVLILINAVVIFLSGFDFGIDVNRNLVLLDNAITVLFLLELYLKLRDLGRGYFIDNWNRLDFVLVLLSIPALITFAFNLSIQDFSFLLVFRVMRVFKSFRFLKFIPGIDHMIRGLKRAMKASVIVMLGFAVYIFIVGIFSFYLFRESSPEFFGNPLLALYATFKIFTIEGWFEIPEEVTQEFSPLFSGLTYLYFIFVVLSGGILGLSVVNSIFVDAMVSDNNDALEHRIDRIEEKIDQILVAQNQKNS